MKEILLSLMISQYGSLNFNEGRDLFPVVESCSIMGKIGFVLSYYQILEGDISQKILIIDEYSKEYSPLTSQMYKEFIPNLVEQVSELEIIGDHMKAMSQSLGHSHDITKSCIKHYMEKK